MQIVGFLNGKNKNYDYQLTAANRAVMTGGVLGPSDLLVTSGSVAAGSALIEVTRTNGQKILVHFENTDAFPIATTGTTKIYVLVDQAKIDDGTANSPDGTGIATIASGTSYPDGNFIPLASVTGGVITDERATISLRNVKRKGMVAKRVLVVDSSGNETELSGTEGQAVVFDASGNPVAMTPTVDMHGLSAVTSTSNASEVIVYDNAAAANRKMALSDFAPEMVESLFGDGSDGSLSISSGTTSLTATSGFVVKQYEDLTISGTATLDLQGEFNVIYVRGTFAMTAGTVTALWRGGAGGITTADTKVTGAAGRTLELANLFIPGSAQAGAGSSTFILSNSVPGIRVSSGAGGCSGQSRTNGQNSGSGGNGGGVIVIIANRFNFIGGTINASGGNAVNPTYDGSGGGGGGGGGTIALIVNKIISNAWSKLVNGGNGASTPVGYSSGRTGGGGAGGYGASGGAGWNAGANGTAGGSNAYGTWGAAGSAGSASAYTGGGGGGGAAGAYYITSPKVA